MIQSLQAQPLFGKATIVIDPSVYTMRKHNPLRAQRRIEKIERALANPKIKALTEQIPDDVVLTYHSEDDLDFGRRDIITGNFGPPDYQDSLHKVRWIPFLAASLPPKTLIKRALKDIIRYYKQLEQAQLDS